MAKSYFKECFIDKIINIWRKSISKDGFTKNILSKWRKSITQCFVKEIKANNQYLWQKIYSITLLWFFMAMYGIISEVEELYHSVQKLFIIMYQVISQYNELCVYRIRNCIMIYKIILRAILYYTVRKRNVTY